MELEFDRTCFACPEQYDVYDGDEKVGYVRLRHGYFRVEAYDIKVFGRDFNYEIHPHDLEPEEVGLPDHASDGAFDNYEARDAYLTIANRKIVEFIYGKTD